MFLVCLKVPVCLTTVDTFWPSFFFIGSISLFFLVPLFILIVLYSVIAKHLMINPSLISAQGNRSNFIKYRKQVILMLATVVVSFFTCLLPFRAFTLWIILVPSETIMSLLSSERGEKILWKQNIYLKSKIYVDDDSIYFNRHRNLLLCSLFLSLHVVFKLSNESHTLQSDVFEIPRRVRQAAWLQASDESDKLVR